MDTTTTTTTTTTYIPDSTNYKSTASGANNKKQNRWFRNNMKLEKMDQEGSDNWIEAQQAGLLFLLKDARASENFTIDVDILIMSF